MTTIEMMIALSDYFEWLSSNVIIPNVSQSVGIHECDILVITKAGYLSEVEIKISKQDLIKDKLKKHNHQDDRIKQLYFAIPEKLKDCTEYIPERAGIIIVKDDTFRYSNIPYEIHKTELIRNSETNKNVEKISDELRIKILRAGCIRIWKLYGKIYQLKHTGKEREDERIK